MAIITSPENLKNLAHYKEISQRLAHAEGISSEQAHALAREGKAVVWIDGGLHATETVGSQQLMEMVYQMVSRNDPETLRLLQRRHPAVRAGQSRRPGTGGQLVHAREGRDAAARMNSLPRLYNKYIGHDDNRDSLISNMPETTNMNRQLFIEWNPQIMYNHHQTGPAGAVIFMPPFRDPFNYNFDPLVTAGHPGGGHRHAQRLVARGQGRQRHAHAGQLRRWWNGGMRNTCTYHNTIGF